MMPCQGSAPPARVRSISSTMTMAFLMTIPKSASIPIRPMKLNGNPVMSRPATIPMRDSGTDRKMMIGCRTLFQRTKMVSSIARKASGKVWLIPALARALSSY